LKKHFILLDGLRGIAALAVGYLHASQIFEVSASPFPAYLAVDFFFCLSGFVVAFAYDDRLASGMTMFDFSLRRLIRLYPMIIVGVLLGLFSTAGKLTLAGGHGLQETFMLAIAAVVSHPVV
jgi:peptidoglycan/LPS O-acetylase OafA/YrhL